jgi:hypothetical protein
MLKKYPSFFNPAEIRKAYMKKVLEFIPVKAFSETSTFCRQRSNTQCVFYWKCMST